jgi:serine/threonine protein kinase
LNTQGDAKLADFGITKELQSTLAVADSFVGTSAYMSPERLLGKSYTFSSDIWSLGVVLLEAACGKFPYPAALGFVDQVTNVVEGPVPKAPSQKYSASFQAFCDACLVKDDVKRPSATALREHAWIKRGGQTCTTRKHVIAWVAKQLARKDATTLSEGKLTSIADGSYTQTMQQMTLETAKKQKQQTMLSPVPKPKLSVSLPPSATMDDAGADTPVLPLSSANVRLLDRKAGGSSGNLRARSASSSSLGSDHSNSLRMLRPPAAKTSKNKKSKGGKHHRRKHSSSSSGSATSSARRRSLSNSPAIVSATLCLDNLQALARNSSSDDDIV